MPRRRTSTRSSPPRSARWGSTGVLCAKKTPERQEPRSTRRGQAAVQGAEAPRTTLHPRGAGRGSRALKRQEPRSPDGLLAAVEGDDGGAFLPLRHDALGGEDRGKRAALAGRRADVEPRTVAGEDMLDDGEPEPGAAGLARAAAVDAIEPLGQARDVLGRDPFAGVGH